MSILYLYGAGIILCLVFSNFFSMTEMTYSSCSTLRLENLAQEGDRRAKTAHYITSHFDNALSAILIGNNLANIAGSSLSTLFIMALFNLWGRSDYESYTWVATLGITVLVIIFGETIPKIVAKKNANRYALKWAFPIRALMIALFPLVWLVVGLVKLITKPLKPNLGAESAEEAVEELQSIIETAEDENVLDEETTELVQSAIDFQEISAYEAMTARVDMYAIDIEDDWENIISLVEESPYSRIPVYRERTDDIIGVLYLNQFLKALTDSADGRINLESLLMKPVFVYKTMKLPDVLSQLKKEKQHLAIVSDEYGGVLGVISMEDVLEEIVGEIWDEEDEIEEEVTELSEGSYTLDGYMTLYDFLELCGLREEDFDFESQTLGGWTVEMFGRFPEEGESFNFEGHKITVLKMDGRRVERILCEKTALS